MSIDRTGKRENVLTIYKKNEIGWNALRRAQAQAEHEDIMQDHAYYALSVLKEA